MRALPCAVLLSAACAANGQDADVTLTFEVASIKVSAPPSVDPHIQEMRTPRDPGRFTRWDTPLSVLIIMAYHLKPYEYAGPSWLTSARFDVVAKVPEGATQAQQVVMLQNLLAVRFGLKVHREKREMTIYDLAIAKGGPKFKESVPVPPPPTDGSSRPPFTTDADGIPALPPGSGTMWGLPGKDGRSWGVMHEETTMQRLAGILESLIGGRPVNDETGLKGKYDVAMHWLMHEDPLDNSMPATPTTGAGPAVFAALESQLGLKLESKKGTVEVLVVDHCEKLPTEN
jgi:uncharacterized protein (TIGR03435 family)